MEPLYNDGDILLIEPTCEISIGEIGIFNVNGLAYVKVLSDDLGELADKLLMNSFWRSHHIHLPVQ